MPNPRLIPAILILALALAAPAASASGSPGPSREERVHRAMLAVYIHGVTDELAESILEPEDLPFLRALLADPGFPRRDNVVAFLAHMDRGDSTKALLAHMMDPRVDVDVPEEDRALLLAPQALGRIAARGDDEALDALLSMTSDTEPASPLLSGAAAGLHAEARRADMIEMAMRGLAFSGAAEARRRLEDLAQGRMRLEARGRDLAASARAALGLFEEARGGRRSPAGPGAPLPALDAPGTGTTSLSGGGVTTDLLDSQNFVHNAGLTYANHSQIPSPMDDARLDAVLREASLRAGREDFVGDVACCNLVSRSGSALTFSGAGLDVIDTGAELTAVLNDPVARVKVVRAINYCGGGPGTNIVGCAWVGATGMSLVRMSQLGDEAILWIHEYGHNTGLNHAGDSRYLMYGTILGSNNALDQAECNAYHNPADGSSPAVTGTCADSDGDLIHDGVDNCPFLPNPTQVDTDGDGQGDPCDGDADSDGVEDAADCAPLNNLAWALPGDAVNLDLTESIGGSVLTWDVPPSPGGLAAGLQYDTLQAVSSTGFDAAPLCVESDDGPDTTASTAQPLAAAWDIEGNLANAGLGASVASAGDVNDDGVADIITGAPRYTAGQDQEGRAYVYSSPYGTSFSPVVTESNVDFAKYGQSVASAGDVNGDGFSDVIVGAPLYSDAVVFGGKAYVYHGSAAGPGASPAWTAAEGSSSAWFGGAVASAGDVNGDGFDDVIVGARFHTEGLGGEGGAFVFHGSAGGLAASPAWSPAGGSSGANFGYAVAPAGDVNGDGYDDVIVGAPKYSNGQATEGAAFIFLGSSAGLSESPQIVLEMDQAGAEFGNSVASAGDVNDDGYDDVIVGAHLYDDDQTDEGAAFIFPGSAAGVMGSPIWSVTGDQAGAACGTSVSSAGDFNGDGFVDIVVSAKGYDAAFSEGGRVQIYPGSASGLSTTPSDIIDGEQAGDQIGTSVALAGDVDGDGFDDLLIGAEFHDNGQLNEGRAVLYLGRPGSDPAVGEIFYYLVRAQNACGSGPAGFASSGLPRTAATCP